MSVASAFDVLIVTGGCDSYLNDLNSTVAIDMSGTIHHYDYLVIRFDQFD